MKLQALRIETPIGLLTLCADSHALRFASFDPKSAFDAGSFDFVALATAAPLLKRAAKAVERYFKGDLIALDSIPCQADGTDFQEEIWDQLRAIEPGKFKSYGELAAKVKRPGAARAVGSACGKNPLILFVPCHRVLANKGHLGGFSAGLQRKRFLLKLEGIAVPPKG